MVVKYKQLTKLKDINLIPSRIFKFKRSKWSKTKVLFSTKFSKGIYSSHYNSMDTNTSISFWNKISKNYKEKLVVKKKYKYIFGQSWYLSNNKNKLQILSSLLSPFYSPTFIFFILNFTGSKTNTKQKIFFKKLSLNNLVLTKRDLSLNSGDILTLVDKFTLLDNYNKFNLGVNISICELDMYAQQIVFIKNKNQLSEEDIENILFETFNIF